MKYLGIVFQYFKISMRVNGLNRLTKISIKMQKSLEFYRLFQL